MGRTMMSDRLIITDLARGNYPRDCSNTWWVARDLVRKIPGCVVPAGIRNGPAYLEWGPSRWPFALRRSEGRAYLEYVGVPLECGHFPTRLKGNSTNVLRQVKWQPFYYDIFDPAWKRP